MKAELDPTTATKIYDFFALVSRVWIACFAISPETRETRLWRVVGRESWLLCRANELMLIMPQKYFYSSQVQRLQNLFSEIKTNKWNGIGYFRRRQEIVCLRGWSRRTNKNFCISSTVKTLFVLSELTERERDRKGNGTIQYDKRNRTTYHDFFLSSLTIVNWNFFAVKKILINFATVVDERIFQSSASVEKSLRTGIHYCNDDLERRAQRWGV